jgi:hypothetical protein
LVANNAQVISSLYLLGTHAKAHALAYNSAHAFAHTAADIISNLAPLKKPNA